MKTRDIGAYITVDNARDYAKLKGLEQGAHVACGMRHVASGETRRQCSTEESADTAPAKTHTTGHIKRLSEQPMNSELDGAKGWA